MTKSIIFVLTLFCLNCFSQNIAIVDNKLKVNASYSERDSAISIIYTNKSDFPQLIWVGDFLTGAILTSTDVSGSYLASPISHELYVVSSSLPINKFSNSYFWRPQDSTELRMSNYLLMDPQDTMNIRIKVPKALIQAARKDINLRMAVSVLDFTTIDLYFRSRQPPLDRSFLRVIQSDNARETIFNNNYEVNLSSDHWKFGRTVPKKIEGDPLKHDLPIQIPETAKQSERDLIKNPIRRNSSKDMYFPMPLADLYRFSTKLIYNIRVK